MVSNENTFHYWRDQGLSVRAANALCDLNCQSVTDLAERGPEEISHQRGMGNTTYQEICELVGWPVRKLLPKRATPWTAKELLARSVGHQWPKPQRTESVISRTMTERVSLHFRFHIPEIENGDAPSNVRLKIENGVIYFKPVAGSGSDGIPITLWQPPKMRAKMENHHPMFKRINVLLRRVGWEPTIPYFALDQAQHGWYSVTTRPSKSAPDRDHVFVWLLDLGRRISPVKQMQKTRPTFPKRVVTPDDVARVIMESQT